MRIPCSWLGELKRLKREVPHDWPQQPWVADSRPPERTPPEDVPGAQKIVKDDVLLLCIAELPPSKS